MTTTKGRIELHAATQRGGPTRPCGPSPQADHNTIPTAPSQGPHYVHIHQDSLSGYVAVKGSSDVQKVPRTSKPSEMLGRRDYPERFPTIEEYEEVLRRCSEPIWSNSEGAGEAWRMSGLYDVG